MLAAEGELHGEASPVRFADCWFRTWVRYQFGPKQDEFCYVTAYDLKEYRGDCEKSDSAVEIHM
jgi:hypothetical protein